MRFEVNHKSQQVGCLNLDLLVLEIFDTSLSLQSARVATTFALHIVVAVAGHQLLHDQIEPVSLRPGHYLDLKVVM